jgi:hypothetical protein
MGQAKAFFTISVDNYSRAYPVANFRDKTEPVRRAAITGEVSTGDGSYTRARSGRGSAHY